MSGLIMTRFETVRPVSGRTGVRHLIASPRTMLRAYQTRRALMQLSPRERADIGVSLSAALTEAARLPWDVTPGPRRYARGAAHAIQSALERARTRRLIGRLEARDLRDIGISPSDAQVESAKFFWQV